MRGSARGASGNRRSYGRHLAIGGFDGEDLNAWMVYAGWAMAYRKYSTANLPKEAAARAVWRGIWRGGERLPGAAGAPEDEYRLKGNISSAGRTYHHPGGGSYGRTKIDESKGERWFCSPEEAEAAGWRAAKR